MREYLGHLLPGPADELAESVLGAAGPGEEDSLLVRSEAVADEGLSLPACLVLLEARRSHRADPL